MSILDHRWYHSEHYVMCGGCADSGPKVAGHKASAVSAARKLGWKIGKCFLCPKCRAKVSDKKNHSQETSS